MNAADIFGRKKSLVGMIHLQALPGTPKGHLPIDAIVDQAIAEARLLAKAGFDALIIENMHDAPYLRRNVGPEIIAAMTTIATEIRDLVSLPLGIQVLAGANQAAIAIAHAVGLQFIRAEGFVFASVADEGLMDEADAGPLLRYRKQIGASDVAIFCDLKKKHSAHALTNDVSLAETAKAAEFFGANGLIVTGKSTGDPTHLKDVEAVRLASELPLLVGSGVTPDNCASMLNYADALIVGSWFKEDGYWGNHIDGARVKTLVDAVNAARGQ